MRERPILFSGPMVRAILDGRKTQTRRVMKPQPIARNGRVMCWKNDYDAEYFSTVGEPEGEFQCRAKRCCPYGGPGDRLWVREGFAYCPKDWKTGGVIYRADGENKHVMSFEWRPSIHMPRVASRLTLELTDVRVERVREISRDEIKAEGCKVVALAYGDDGEVVGFQADFALLWDSINAKRGFGWDKNPWVWVVEFRKCEPAR